MNVHFGFYYPFRSHMEVLQYGRPNAGLVSPEEAQKYQMVHIGLGVYIHSDQYFEVIRKKNDGQAMVRILMNFFFSKDQMKGGTLSERGCGRMLDPLLTKAIVMWVQKTQESNCSPVTLRQAMYRKLSYHKWRAKKEHVLHSFSLKNNPISTATVKEETDEDNFVDPPSVSAATSQNAVSVAALNNFNGPAPPLTSSPVTTNLQTVSENTNQTEMSLPSFSTLKHQLQQHQQQTLNRITLHQQQLQQQHAQAGSTLLPFDILPQNCDGASTMITGLNAGTDSVLTPLELIAKERGGITVNMECLNTLLSFVCCPTCHSPVNHKETIQGFKTGILYSLQLFCVNGHKIQSMM